MGLLCGELFNLLLAIQLSHDLTLIFLQIVLSFDVTVLVDITKRVFAYKILHGRAFLYSRFVGCIGSVTYLTKKRERRHAQERERIDTTSGCENPCKKNPCENGGRCLNWFIRTGCDCIGTGYEGPRCTRGMY